jgi:hypothetical protein
MEVQKEYTDDGVVRRKGFEVSCPGRGRVSTAHSLVIARSPDTALFHMILSFPLNSTCPISHRLYDAITSDAPEYYLFQAELDLLKQHGPEMVRQMGISSSSSSSTTPDYSASGPHSDSVRNDKENERGENGDEERHQRKAEPKNSEKWGDGVVGRWNDGVNGEDGIQGKGSAECDIVELGAG